MGNAVRQQPVAEAVLCRDDVRVDRRSRDTHLVSSDPIRALLFADQRVAATTDAGQRGERVDVELFQLALVEGEIGPHPRMRALDQNAAVLLVMLALCLPLCAAHLRILFLLAERSMWPASTHLIAVDRRGTGPAVPNRRWDQHW